MNEKKSRIVQLKDGVPFLKGKYVLLESGRVLRLPHPDGAKRMRRKLKKFRNLIDAGKLNYADLRTAYQSWRGNFRKRFNAYYCILSLDTLYNKLFIQRVMRLRRVTVYIAKKNGRVYCHKSLEGLKQFGIIKADMEIPDAEFEVAGSVARLVDGKIFIGKTEAEAAAEYRQSRQAEIENLLKSIDTKSGRAARAAALAVSCERYFETGVFFGLRFQDQVAGENGSRRGSAAFNAKRPYTALKYKTPEAAHSMPKAA